MKTLKAVMRGEIQHLEAEWNAAAIARGAFEGENPGSKGGKKKENLAVTPENYEKKAKGGCSEIEPGKPALRKKQTKKKTR